MFIPEGLSKTIFAERYAINAEETWEDACMRVSSTIASIEEPEKIKEIKQKFFEEISSNRFCPAGRIWYGSSRPKGQLLNCFVVPTMDSREGWGDTVRDSIIVSGTGGGVGFNFSSVRPRGSEIRGHSGKATGATSLMEIVNAAGEVIRAGGGRRTALMLCLNHDHPDVPEFMDKKLDLKQLNNANVSVVFMNESIDKFLKKVEKDELHEFMWNENVISTMPARDLWNKILDNSVTSGEPGILNGCLANEQNNIWYYRQLESTNPCQPGWASIITPNGLKQLKEVNIGDTIWSESGWTKIINKFSTGKKPVYRYRTTSGVFYGTENHKLVSSGTKVEAKDCDSIDILTASKNDTQYTLDPQDIMDGLIMGDGSVHKASNNLIYLNIGKDDYDYINSEIKSYLLEERKGLSPYAWEIKTTLLADEVLKINNRTIPERYVYTQNSKLAGFLKGLYSANGSVVGQRVTLKTTSTILAEQVQQMLSALGISSYFTTNKSRPNEFKNGTYTMSESYDVNVGSDRELFYNKIGFLQKYKMEKLKQTLIPKKCTRAPKITYDIISVDEMWIEEVFDITVDNQTHTYWTGGVNVSNCGEIWLEKYGCCDLGALVLPRFIKDGQLDRKLLARTIQIAVRFLDNVLDVNTYPLKAIEDNCKEVRRIGLGVMGLHDMLILLGKKYTSDEGRDYINSLFSFIKKKAYEASIYLAVEKGQFPALNRHKFVESGFCKDSLSEGMLERILEYGIRNCAVLTIAPTGTTSLLSGVTSGIEPIYAFAYKRRFRSGESLQEETMQHPLFAELKDKVDNSIFESALNIPVEDHIKMQVICQAHVDNAISKTINVPKNYVGKDLDKVVRKYVGKMKGITLYRDGSRGESPIEPLSLEEAAQLNCKSGVCDI